MCVCRPCLIKNFYSLKGTDKVAHHTFSNLVFSPFTPPPLLFLLPTPTPSVTPSDTVVRRSISQQSCGVSITIDDPVRTTRQLSPPHGKVSNIIHVTNLVGSTLDCGSKTQQWIILKKNNYNCSQIALNISSVEVQCFQMESDCLVYSP